MKLNSRVKRRLNLTKSRRSTVVKLKDQAHALAVKRLEAQPLTVETDLRAANSGTPPSALVMKI